VTTSTRQVGPDLQRSRHHPVAPVHLGSDLEVGLQPQQGGQRPRTRAWSSASNSRIVTGSSRRHLGVQAEAAALGRSGVQSAADLGHPLASGRRQDLAVADVMPAGRMYQAGPEPAHPFVNYNATVATVAIAVGALAALGALIYQVLQGHDADAQLAGIVGLLFGAFLRVPGQQEPTHPDRPADRAATDLAR
jgi:hypothetical protein